MTIDVIVVCALYRFVRLNDFQELQRPLIALMKKHGVKGTLLLANEGINGTIAGSRAGIDAVLAQLRLDPRLASLSCKESLCDSPPFYRSKVKLKKEIVTMGVEDIDPNKVVGTYVKPQDWNKLIDDPEVLLIDTRNDYEVNIGTFKNATNPNIKNFREFPQYATKHLDPKRHKKIAMFCTGGIRCEKSTAYLKNQGFEEVYHLEGGILKYLETVPEEQSLWEGECFVFDNRIAVTQGLGKGSYDQCFACRHPITEEDKKRSEYIQGVSCHLCLNDTTEQQRQRFASREKQILLAKKRGIKHIGIDAREQQNHQQSTK